MVQVFSVRFAGAFAAIVFALAIAVGLASAVRATSPHRAFAAPGAAPPRNDNSADALVVNPSNWENEVDTTGATLEPGEPPACGDIGATVWYRIRAIEDGRVRVTTNGTAFRTVLAAYETAARLPSAASSRLGCAAGGPTLEFDVRAGKDYFVQAGGVNGASGLLKFQLTCLTACPGGTLPVPATPTVGPGGTLPVPATPAVGPASTFPVPATPAAGSGGSIRLPDTGSGGYLPGAR